MKIFNILSKIFDPAATFLIFFLMFFDIGQVAAQSFINKGKTSFELVLSEDLPQGWDYQNNTENPHGIIVTLQSNPRINDIPLQYGDFIGAFYTDENGDLKCGGADFWNGSQNIIFPVFGNDPDTPEKDGFAYNEIMYLKVFLQETQKDYNADIVAWDPSYSTNYRWFPLGLSSILNFRCNVAFDAFATVDKNPICQSDTLHLEANIYIATNGNYTYNWSSEPQGLNSTSPVTSHTPATNIFYTLEVSDGTNNSTHSFWVIINENPQIDAGEPATICVNQTAQLAAQGNFYSGVFWTTAGDGSFQNPNAITTNYFPGTADIGNAPVVLTVTANPLSPCQTEATDNIAIEFQHLPAVALPTDITFCENQAMIIEAVADQYNNIFWTTSGDGTFLVIQDLTVQYFPGPSDLSTNDFVVTATVNAIAPCLLSAFDQTMVTLSDVPSINAPASRTGCENTPVNLNSIVAKYSTLLWTTEGDGTFGNPTIPATKYYPGNEDKTNGGTLVTINAFGNGACQNIQVSKNIQIVLIGLPEANAGIDSEICNGSIVFTAGDASDYSYVSWATAGDGYFNNINVLNPVYYPGPLDCNSENIYLYLTAYANYPCATPDSDTIIITVVQPPKIEIGANRDTICYGEIFYFSQATASDYSVLEWFSVSGSGTFDDNTLINPTYYPDSGDYQPGSVIIGVIAYPAEPCTIADDDFISLSFQAPPAVMAAEDATIIQGDIFIATAVADNYSAVIWETSGDGTFENPGNLSSEYFPGSNDVQNYHALLTVFAMPLNVCNIAHSDSLGLTILRTQEIIIHEGINSFSSYIEAGEISFEEMMTPISDKVVFAQKFINTYWPCFNISTMGKFSNQSGYKMMMSSDTIFRFSGYEVDNKNVLLQPGWNILPVLSACPVSCQQLIDQLGTTLIVIREIDGNKLLWPSDGLLTLTELEPGKAYMIKVNSQTTFTFIDCN